MPGLDQKAYLLYVVGVSLLRPFARRALITLRPPGLDMRSLKPWLRTLFKLEGWNVRFTSTVLIFEFTSIVLSFSQIYFILEIEIC